MSENEYAVFAPALKKQILMRRIKLFGLTAICIVLATLKWMTSLPSDISVALKIVMVSLFFLTFGWIALFFFSSLFGFFELVRAKNVPGIIRPAIDTPLKSRTAVLMPVYNEDPEAVFAGLLAMARELEKTGQGDRFDIFVLSDSTKPDVWVKEEILWVETKKIFPKDMNLFYRHRPKNTARKSGNIEDFCVRFGAHYDYMLVLDADSLMAGETMLKMAQMMQANPTTGIIQAPPVLINRKSWFARVQQFAGHVYGPVITMGLAYWQVWDSNYWGHNAIIRTKAFIECCGLPVFKGKAPFGGHILSHDFVEAALIRRHGWLAWMLPDLKGSYEECPPSMIDFAVRDRRWCQGNLQHARILLSKKFHPISRVHFTLGIMSYLSSPLWFLFLVGGLGIALWRAFYPPVYFAPTKTLFPTWPVMDIVGIVLLLILSMMMLFLPKFLGVAAIFIRRQKSVFGGKWALIKGTLVEIVFSALIAPIMMLFQTKIVFDILLGLDAGWNTQNRSETGTSWRDAFRRHIFHTLIGAAVCFVTYRYVPGLFYWTLPIVIGPILSIPISVYSSRESTGLWAKKHGLFLIPSEKQTPQIVRETHRALKELKSKLPQKTSPKTLIENPLYGAAHAYLMSVNGPAPDFENKVVRAVRQKVQAYVSAGVILDLSPDEAKCLLYDTALIMRLSAFKARV